MYEAMNDTLLFSGILLWTMVGIVVLGIATGKIRFYRGRADDADETREP